MEASNPLLDVCAIWDWMVWGGSKPGPNPQAWVLKSAGSKSADIMGPLVFAYGLLILPSLSWTIKIELLNFFRQGLFCSSYSVMCHVCDRGFNLGESNIWFLFLLEELPHNVVYQNEEGRWVTDLAYYTSFKEQAFNHSDISGDFISGCKSDYNIEVTRKWHVQ